MGLSVDQLQGLINTTLSKYGRGKLTDLAYDKQEYVVMDKLLNEKKVIFDGGKSYQFNVMTKKGGNARHYGMYETDNVNVTDGITQGEVPWRFTQASYAFDVKEEKINSPKAEQIVDLILARRAQEIAGLAELLEETFWGKPTDSSDKVTPFGIDYWIVKNASEGFNGGNPSGFTAGCAGIDASAYSNWMNYTGTYSSARKTELVKKMKKAARLTNFKSPVKHPNYDTSGNSQKFQIYVNESTISDIETIGEGQNENLGRDIDSMYGTLTFHNNPIIYVPQLDDASDDPVYMVNWGVFFLAFLKDWFLKENTKPAPNQNDVVQVFVEMAWNSVCVDRRKQAIFYKA